MTTQVLLQFCAVSELQGRTFATWTLTSCLLCLICARNPCVPAIYGEEIVICFSIVFKMVNEPRVSGSQCIRRKPQSSLFSVVHDSMQVLLWVLSLLHSCILSSSLPSIAPSAGKQRYSQWQWPLFLLYGWQRGGIIIQPMCPMRNQRELYIFIFIEAPGAPELYGGRFPPHVDKFIHISVELTHALPHTI